MWTTALRLRGYEWPLSRWVSAKRTGYDDTLVVGEEASSAQTLKRACAEATCTIRVSMLNLTHSEIAAASGMLMQRCTCLDQGIEPFGRTLFHDP
jgi:hypothetical protein